MEQTEALEIFMNLHYPELKSFGIAFLTLVSSIFSLSILFVDKIAVRGKRISIFHIPLVAAWISYSISIIFCGYGLWRLFGAAQVASGWISEDYYDGSRLQQVELIYSHVYLALNAAGLMFILGLALMGVSGLFHLIKQPEVKDL